MGPAASKKNGSWQLPTENRIWLRKYYYSPNFSRFMALKIHDVMKKSKFFQKNIAQFNYWQYLCTAFFGR